MDVKKFRGQSTRMFSVDWDSYDDLNALFNQVKGRRNELRRIRDNTPSRQERSRLDLEACQQIWNSDISAVYSGLSLDGEANYYVYAHLDPSRKIAVGMNSKTTFAAILGMKYWPFYVGKGTGDRGFELNRNETHRKIRERMEYLGYCPEVFIVRDGLTEVEAFAYESKLIDIFGLVPNHGYLTNLDEGFRPEQRRQVYRDAYLRLNKIARDNTTHV